MTYHRGPWESDGVSLSFQGSPPQQVSCRDELRPHPLWAPVAWLACFVAGAAFWVAVFKVIF